MPKHVIIPFCAVSIASIFRVEMTETSKKFGKGIKASTRVLIGWERVTPVCFPGWPFRSAQPLLSAFPACKKGPGKGSD